MSRHATVSVATELATTTMMAKDPTHFIAAGWVGHQPHVWRSVQGPGPWSSTAQWLGSWPEQQAGTPIRTYPATHLTASGDRPRLAKCLMMAVVLSARPPAFSRWHDSDDGEKWMPDRLQTPEISLVDTDMDPASPQSGCVRLDVL